MPDSEFETPQQAEEAFYRAFELRDLDAMMQVWSDADYIECIHPMQDRLQGHSAIRASWAEILKRAPEVTFRNSDPNITCQGKLSIHVIYEILQLGDKGLEESRMITTNIYEKTSRGWKIIMHHASPAPKQTGRSDTATSKILH
ncbi:MAG: nuclear transport factor 2 family protein [Proteobacteria bacterium]|jgi:ketosteroid isomerase-like protein|nr:nuclear transport factor 2 family protein [Pseudomonadota bacterium]MCG6934420.1 nuclear transport factor 2 family protein [Pseudomonadota bacterium]